MRILIIFISIHFFTYSMEIEQTAEMFKKNYPIFFQNIKPLNLSNEELNSLYQHIEDYQKGLPPGIDINDKPFRYFKDSKKSNLTLFFAWLFKANFKSINYNTNKTIKAGGGFFFFGQIDYAKKNLTIDSIYRSFKISKSPFFNGKEGKFYHNKNQSSNLSILNSILETDQQFLGLAPLIKKCAQTVYKIHLMPTKESLYITVYKLCKVMRKNPKIFENIYLCDLINDFKVALNPYEKGSNFPIIVIYTPTIFISDEELLENFNIDKLEQNFNNYVDYEKSKQCLELLLTFLIQFFNENKECIGSGVVPRFNAKVTDMIFFAQGNGDDKEIPSLKEYFEENLIYFKAEQGENFKVDIDALVKKALQSQSQSRISDGPPKSQSPEKPLHESRNISQTQVQTQVKTKNPPVVQSENVQTTTQKNDNVGGIDFFYGIKQFFHSLLQSILSYFGF